MAINTIFGWAIIGRYSPDTKLSPSPPALVCHTLNHPSLDDPLQRFWENEEVSSTPCHTPEEKVVLEHFKSNHICLPQGRYRVSLPKKPDSPPLGESRTQAVKRYYSNENSITRKGTWQQFQDVIQEYVDLGHSELVPPADLEHPQTGTYYLPMHAVIKNSSSTTKLRVVFDASAKTTSGHSLNDTLLVGPTLYPTITDILLLFRSYPIAISGDISKMYRAVEMAPGDRDLHRFVWRADHTSQLADYRMTRVTFGVAASPFAAVRALQQTAADFGHDYILATPHVYESFYVYDCLAGAQTPQEAITLHLQLRSLLLKGGYDLRKWRSNSKDVLDAIPKDLHEPSQTKLLSDDSTTQHPKALGMYWDASNMYWDASNDVFFVSTGTLTHQTTTKRSIVSDIARTFDVLGWLAPTTVTMKILFQKLWELRLEWNEEVPPYIQQQHLLWRKQLSQPWCI